uniref:Uncharacterized protein n=1 Tax=Tetraselmis sp. GSL018 TaxID=582737 RepID=A0A061RFY1_9CHLO
MILKFVDQLRLEGDNPLKSQLRRMKQSLMQDPAGPRSPGGGGGGGADGWSSRSIGEYVRFPEFSFAGQPPIVDLEKGQVVKQPWDSVGEVESKFLRNKNAAFPLAPARSRKLMLASDGRGCATMTPFSDGDYVWGEKARGVSPSPNDPAAGRPAQVIVYRGPGGAFMRRKVRPVAAPGRDLTLEEKLAQYDLFLTKEKFQSPNTADGDRQVMNVQACSSGAADAQKDFRNGGADNSFRRQLNLHLGTMASMFGGLDPFQE